jgi:hypothetical protein
MSVPVQLPLGTQLIIKGLDGSWIGPLTVLQSLGENKYRVYLDKLPELSGIVTLNGSIQAFVAHAQPTVSFTTTTANRPTVTNQQQQQIIPQVDLTQTDQPEVRTDLSFDGLDNVLRQ